MTGSTAIPPDEAARTLAGLGSTRGRTRSDLRSYWYPLVVFGALTLLSTPFFSLWDGSGVGLFWLVAAPGGFVAVSRHYRRRALSTGVARSPRAHVMTGYGLIASCFALGFGGGIGGQPDIATFGPPLSIAAAYVVFGWLESSPLLVLLACSLGGLTVALATADVADAARMLALAYGVSFVAVGLLVRTWTPNP